VSAVDGWGRAGSGRGEGSTGARVMGREGGGGGRIAGAREMGGLGRKRPRRGGEFFLFPFSIFYFYFFYLLFF
jgi:hypothetical protein